MSMNRAQRRKALQTEPKANRPAAQQAVFVSRQIKLDAYWRDVVTAKLKPKS